MAVGHTGRVATFGGYGLAWRRYIRGRQAHGDHHQRSRVADAARPVITQSEGSQPQLVSRV